MEIQNAPLDKKQLKRIKAYILRMNNKMACKAQTGIDTRTIDTIVKRKWASTDHIEKLMNYCDMVEGYAR